MKIPFASVHAPKALVILACGVASLLASRGAMAQGYYTDFNTGSGYTPNASLSDQNGWVTNDEATGATYGGEDIGQSDGVGATGYSSVRGDNMGQLGGEFNEQGYAVPGAPVVTLTHAANVPALTTSTTFVSDFVVSAPDMAGPNHDSFGFVFQSSGGATLFGVNFVQTSLNSSTADNVTVTSGNGLGATMTSGGLSSFSLGYRYRLSLSINIVPGVGGTFSVAMTPETFGGVISGASSTLVSGDAFTGTIANVGTYWALADTTTGTADAGTTTAGGNNTPYVNGGDNTLLFDNFGFVPEPSEYAMFGLGLAVLLVMVRRRSQAA